MTLEEIIREKIKNNGPIEVSDFVELALYHPEFGFYNRIPPVIGKKGDFYTSSDLHPIFGRTLGRFLMSTGSPVVLEVGAGKGWLAHDILLEYKGEYWIVEKSRVLADIEKNVLKEFPNVKWFKTIDEVPEFDGFFISNELFDAFPFNLYKNDNGEWFEILLNEDFTYELKPVNEKIKKILARYEGVKFAVIPVGWETLIKKLAERHTGEILVIDYGYEREELIKKFPFGTIQTYKNHAPGGHFTENAGEQDITFFIDFTLLKEIFKDAGYSELSLKTQAEFLIENGVIEILQEYEKIADEKERVKARLAVKTLILDFGRSFKTLRGKKTLSL